MMRKEIRQILNISFKKEDKELFEEFAIIIENDYKNDETQKVIWEYDQKIKGFGGYAAPLDPKVNYFNQLGDYRNVFRSLQYARCDMYMCSRPRHIIEDSALHFESLVKILLFNNKIFKFKKNTRELGKNLEDLYKKKLIDESLYNRLNTLKSILNLAKHDTDSENDITFDYMDAIVFYFETRKVGNELLKKLNHPTYNKMFPICMDTMENLYSE